MQEKEEKTTFFLSVSAKNVTFTPKKHYFKTPFGMRGTYGASLIVFSEKSSN